ncbi:MAG: transglycosylase SLT domain-containing protein [Porticoccaceae bacterium]|jgi:hypothetical protein|nr:transglycosylase SLT domain-containing protein [Porticoccaceae bacterium]
MVLLLLFALPALAGPIPSTAQQYQRELTRIVQQEWGLGGPVALHAAQIHQESGWRAGVDSRVGAQGLAQFMPGTSAWISEIYPDLGSAAPYSPGWAMRAMARYNKHIHSRIHPHGDAPNRRASSWRAGIPSVHGHISTCDHWAMVLSGYNGGPGWLSRDRRLAAEHGADPDRWFGHVEYHTRRADWAKRENRYYPQRILHELEPRYLRAGWRGRPTC